jgi:hypothetical protein
MSLPKKIEIGPIEINQQQSHPVKWSPIVGVILIIGVLYSTRQRN